MNSIYNTVISHCIHCRRQNNVASTSRRKKCPNMQICANLLHRYKTPKLKYMHSQKEATYHQVIGNFLVGWKKDRLFTFFDFDIGLVSFLLINGFTLALYANNVYTSIQNVAHEKRLARENLLAGQSEKQMDPIYKKDQIYGSQCTIRGSFPLCLYW